MTRSRALLSVVLLLLAPALSEAQDTAPGTIPDLAGSWRIIHLVVSSDGGGPVDLIELGAGLWLTFDDDGGFVLTKQDPGETRRLAETGSWRPVSAESIEILGDGASEPAVYGVCVFGDFMLMSGPLSMDLDGDGLDELVSFEAELEREADKRADGSGIVGAWVRSDGRIRTYGLHVPAEVADRDPAALLLAFHGGDSRGDVMAYITGLDAAADEAGVIVAYPDAVGGQWAIGCDCTPADRQGISDVTFAERLIDQLAAAYPVDVGRVYATGFSQGGMLASRLACEIPHRIAAVATVGGGMTNVLAGRCTPSRPISVVAFHGTADRSVPYEGSGTMLSVPATLELWARVNGCGGSVIEPVADLSDDGTQVTLERYAGCAAGSEATLYTIAAGGHTWPGAPVPFPRELGLVSHDIAASPIMLEFFSRHPLAQGLERSY
jgi:polyhydroxybutyrate depolymerase